MAFFGQVKGWFGGGDDSKPARYEGALGAGTFEFGDGTLLGRDTIVPRAVAFEPSSQLLAVGGRDGQLRLVGCDFELSLRQHDAAAGACAEFLVFPRPGLLLAICVAAAPAPAAAAAPGRQAATWSAQWWDLRCSSVASSGMRSRGSFGGGSADALATPTGVAVLRFGVVSIAATLVENDSFVFLGTDEGDVRVFDAGSGDSSSMPQMSSYCIPGEALQRDKGASRPCPVISLLAPRVGGPNELLIGTAEGAIVAWSLQKHAVTRLYGPLSGPVTALAWRTPAWAASVDSGSRPAEELFVAACASRGVLHVFSSACEDSLAQVALPKGATSSLEFLGWSDSSNTPPATGSPLCGELLIRRGPPHPAVLRLHGPKWVKIDSILDEAHGCLVGAVLCQPRLARRGAAAARGPEPPCGCLVAPSSVAQVGGLGIPAAALNAVKGPAILAVLEGRAPARGASAAAPRLLVRSLGRRPVAWANAWGSLELADATTLQLVPRTPPTSEVPEARRSTAACGLGAGVEVGRTALEELLMGASTTEAAVVEGRLVGDGASALPKGGFGLELADGWLICEAGNHDEDAAASDEDEGVHLVAPKGVRTMTSMISLGLNATALLLLWSSSGEEAYISFDADQEKVSCGGAFVECGIDQHLDLEPGADHTVLLHLDAQGCLRVSWDGASVLGDLHTKFSDGTSEVAALGWRCRAGELRIQTVTLDASAPEGEEASVDGAPAASGDSKGDCASGVADQGEALEAVEDAWFAEQLFARRMAHFASFLAGTEDVHVEEHPFVDAWNAMLGGWQGLLCSGHADGTVKIWLRGHAEILLLHTVSLRCLTPLPWRPQLNVAAAATDAQAWLKLTVYDGVDVAPALAMEADAVHESDPADWIVSAVAFEPSVGALAAGSRGGWLAIYRWRSAPGPIPAALIAASAESNADSAAAMTTAAAASSPLPSGLICNLRLRKHEGEVTQLRLAVRSGGEGEANDTPLLRVVSVDTKSCTNVMDGITGEMLFSTSLVLGGHPGCQPSSASSAAAPPPPPPSEAVEAIAFSNSVLRIAVPGEAQQGSQEAKVDSHSGILGAYIIALSSGELRQLVVPGERQGLRLLDNRISESRLPQLPGGSVLCMHVCADFVLVVLPTAAHVLSRFGSQVEPTPRTTTLGQQRAVAASVVEVEGESCLIALLANIHAVVLSLPGLCPIATVDAVPQALCAAPASVACAAYAAADGTLLLRAACGRSGRPVEGSSWLLTTYITNSHDTAVRALRSAQVAQAVGPPMSKARTASAAAASAPAQQQQSMWGLIGSLFGKEDSIKPLRDCMGGTHELPPAVNAANLDRGRGLPPAWTDPNDDGVGSRRSQPRSRPAFPGTTKGTEAGHRERLLGTGRGVPSRKQNGGYKSGDEDATSSQQALNNVAGVAAGIMEAGRKLEQRGEKVSELQNKSNRLIEDTNKFTDLAKQIRKKHESRWF
eukprot:TRINITY_DN9453_c0_g1_i3.p1 TRINITY_DN9453_c0_g1~~TRINITY_DN9453_c0_g1_i3.p1  ORF type:complete len:1459 (+),score=299.58 TRINITY_DN9453_c0_g1_i3:115-4491(+)